ncbi:hypothetical protein [Brevibacillus centrosporus]|uniref:hypothetical protein n=1 Tax=Brevibacillus centrosporus TaxID=54910 RepID=UPI003B014379
MERYKYPLFTFGLLLAFTLAFWGKSLWEPIANREFSSLASEVVDGVGSAFGNTIREATGESVILEDPSFDLAKNILYPGILYLMSFGIMALIGYFTFKTWDSSSRLDNALQITFFASTVFMGGLFLFNGGKLLLFSIALSAIGLIAAVILFGGLFLAFASLFGSDKKGYN